MKKQVFLLAVTTLFILSCGSNASHSVSQSRAEDSIETFFREFYIGYDSLSRDLYNGKEVMYKEERLENFLYDYCCDDIVLGNAVNSILDQVGYLDEEILKSMSVEKVQGESGMYTVSLRKDTISVKTNYTLIQRNGKLKIYAIDRRKYPMTFSGDTVSVMNLPKRWKGYYRWGGFTVADIYSVADSLILDKDYRVAILVPYYDGPDFFDAADDSMALHTDRLLLIEYKGKRMVFDNVISNESYVIGLLHPFEWLSSVGEYKHNFNNECDFLLNYNGGMGYKVSWTIGIKMVNNHACVSGIEWNELNGGLTFRKQIIQEYDISPERIEFPLNQYSRGEVWRVGEG